MTRIQRNPLPCPYRVTPGLTGSHPGCLFGDDRMDAKKASAYLRYRKNAMSMTFRQIEETSGVSDSTAQAYFAGTVKTMKPDTFLALAASMGGSMEDFDQWEPAVMAPDVQTLKEDEDMKLSEIIESLRQAFNSATLHMESAYNKAFEQIKEQSTREIDNIRTDYAKEIRKQRIEKYILFALLIIFTSYTVFAFVRYDLRDQSSGLTSLF